MRIKWVLLPILTGFIYSFVTTSVEVFSTNLGQPLKNIKRSISKNPKEALRGTNNHTLLNKIKVGQPLTEEDKAYLEHLKVRNAEGKALEDVEKDILKLNREKKEKSRK